MEKFNGYVMRLFVVFIAALVLTFPTLSWSQDSEWTVYNTANSGLPYNGVTGLAIDAQGNVWIGTGKWNASAGGGLAKFDGSNWTVYNTANSPMPNNDHTGLAVDDQGNVWIATEGGTLTKFDGLNWTSYGRPTSSGQLSSPSFDDQGNVWVGSYGGGLAKFDGTNWTIYRTSNSGLPHNRAWATAVDAQGNIWIGTLGGGLAKFDEENWTVYNASNSGLPTNNINVLTFDSRDSLWIGDDGALSVFDGIDWTVFDTADTGLQNDYIMDIEVAAQDNVWIGTFGSGLARYDGTNWTIYNTSNSGLPDDRICALAIDVQGNVWIGTDNGGLAVFRPRPVIDFNGDGIVDIKDLLRLIESWSQDDSTCDIAPVPYGDGIVDALDLELLMSYWGQDVYDPTLLAHWKLDETEGTTANDSAGGIQAELYGDPVWQPTGGMVDGALMLDGIDDFVGTWSISNVSAGHLSVFLWIKGGAPGQVMVSQWRGVNWLMADASGGYLGTDLGDKPLVSEVNITDGQWHRLGLSWDGTNRTLYVDDVTVASDTQANLERSAVTGLNIGCGPNETAGTFFSGLIDDVRIYNRATTP